jgi:ActR/RegA family two-component response regulator
VQNAVVPHAVAVSGGNVSAAARLLDMERKAFERKLRNARRSKGD